MVPMDAFIIIMSIIKATQNAKCTLCHHYVSLSVPVFTCHRATPPHLVVNVHRPLSLNHQSSINPQPIVKQAMYSKQPDTIRSLTSFPQQQPQPPPPINQSINHWLTRSLVHDRPTPLNRSARRIMDQEWYQEAKRLLETPFDAEDPTHAALLQQ